MSSKMSENDIKHLEKNCPDLYRIYVSMQSLFELSGNGSIEVHFVRGEIKKKNGLYIKPGIEA